MMRKKWNHWLETRLTLAPAEASGGSLWFQWKPHKTDGKQMKTTHQAKECIFLWLKRRTIWKRSGGEWESNSRWTGGGGNDGLTLSCPPLWLLFKSGNRQIRWEKSPTAFWFYQWINVHTDLDLSALFVDPKLSWNFRSAPTHDSVNTVHIFSRKTSVALVLCPLISK